MAVLHNANYLPYTQIKKQDMSRLEVSGNPLLVQLAPSGKKSHQVEKAVHVYDIQHHYNHNLLTLFEKGSVKSWAFLLELPCIHLGKVADLHLPHLKIIPLLLYQRNFVVLNLAHFAEETRFPFDKVIR